MTKTKATYDIAISFAGEDRQIASEIASGLVIKGLNVFYDEYAKADLWGKHLYVHLTKIYRDESKYCLMLLSEHYVQKQWTSHERKAAQVRAFEENREYILPLRLDEDVFLNAGIKGPGGHDFKDEDFATSYPTCGKEQRLNESRIAQDGDDTIYSCVNGCQPVAVISRPGLVAWPGRGFRLGSHVIRNAADIIVQVKGMHTPVLIPASKAALMKARPYG